MTDKELRRLRRDDLLQILINQQRQIDDLTASLERAKEKLDQRDIAVAEAGNIAEAALRLNGVFEAAQASADQYVEQMSARADELRQEAESVRDQAKRTADDLVKSARTEADRILREARNEGERLKEEAQKLLDEARQRTGVEPPTIDQLRGKEEEVKQRRGLFGRGRKS